MKLYRDGIGALGTLSMLLSVLLPAPCLAQAGSGVDDPAGGAQEERAEDEAGPSGADSSVDRSRDVEVIVVEGVRTEGLREVPISVTHFGASDIENLRIQNVADLSAYTPNLEINTAFAASNPTLFIRGVGLKDYNSNSTGAVGIWHDGIMMNSPSAQLFSLYDIEGIEVLRGPVGGIGGRNASAGLIRLHSFEPSGDWTSQGSVTYGNYNNLMLEGALGFPIFPQTFGETLSARFSFVSEWRDGYTDNVCADWDPTAYGLLASSEQFTRDFYTELDPFDRGAAFPTNQRYIYRNVEAVELYNAVSGNTINFLSSDPGDGVAGPLVGQQRATLQIPADGVCHLDTAGNLATQRHNNRPEFDWNPSPFSRSLDEFQGLQDTYNNVEYYGSRVLLRYQPTDRLELMGNYHWGENRGDAFHLQSIGVEPGDAQPNTLIEEPRGFFENTTGWSELDAVRRVPFEGIETRDGLRGPRGPNSGPLGSGLATDDPFSGFYDSDGEEKLDLRGTSVAATYDLDWGRILYVGGYEFNSRKIDDEGDASPKLDLAAIYDDETYQVTQDLRLEFEGDGYAVRLGGFYIHEELDSSNLFKSTIRFQIDQTYEQDTDGWNAGAELHYDFLEEGALPWLYQVSLDGGARYNWEQKKFSLGAESIPVTPSGVPNPGASRDTLPEQFERGIWREWTGEATLSMKPIESLRLYGKYTHGYKAGHFNAGLTIEKTPSTPLGEVTQSLDPVAPEIIDAVEVGLKSSWFDGRLDLSGALFRYWYKDLQVFDIVNEADDIPTQQLLNSDADVLGAEAEATLRPLDGMMIQVGLGWLDSEFQEFLVDKRVVTAASPGQAGGGNATFNYEGNPLIAAPEWSLSGYAEYELPLFRWGSIVPMFDFSYKSRTYLDAQMEELISQEPYWLFNARLAYRTPGGRIEVAGWVENLTDEQYKIDAFDLSRQFSSILEVWGEPRMYGVTVSYSF